MSHPIESVMNTTLEQLKQMVDVNTIIGAPVNTPNGTVVLPISKVSFGFVSGGGQLDNDSYQKEKDYPFAGGSGAGVSLNPVAFLVIANDNINIIPATFETTYDRLVEMIPNVITSVKKAMKDE